VPLSIAPRPTASVPMLLWWQSWALLLKVDGKAAFPLALSPALLMHMDKSSWRLPLSNEQAGSLSQPRTELSTSVHSRSHVGGVPEFTCLSHKTPCHPSQQKQIGTPAQLREPIRTPLLYSRPVTRSPRKTPEGTKREEGGENAVIFLWGSRATGAPVAYLLNIRILGPVAPLTRQYSRGGLN